MSEPKGPMIMKMKIDKTGKVVTEVVDRGEHLCSSIYKVTNAVGTQLSDEHIGPECEVHETS